MLVILQKVVFEVCLKQVVPNILDFIFVMFVCCSYRNKFCAQLC